MTVTRQDMGFSEKVVVIGGGIVGLSCAFYARRLGADVTVIDPDEPAAMASFGNAGILAVSDCLPIGNPRLLLSMPKLLLSRDSPLQIRWRYLPRLAPWLLKFTAASLSRGLEGRALALRDLLKLALADHRKIAGASAAAFLIDEAGWIKAAETEQAYAASEDERRFLQDRGVRQSTLSKGDLQELLPGFQNVFAKGTLYSDCAQVRDPGAYIARIRSALMSDQVRFVKEQASGFEFSEGKVVGVRTATGLIKGSRFVLAAGAWSKGLAAQLGEKVSLDTERGYHAMLPVEGHSVLKVPLFWQERSICLTPQVEGIRVTNGVELADLHAAADFGPLDRTVAAIQQLVPALGSRSASRWLGFRPSTPDSLPVIGPAARHPNCHLAFGHGHLGLTLGPVTGRLVAEAMAGMPAGMDMQPFSPGRF